MAVWAVGGPGRRLRWGLALAAPAALCVIIASRWSAVEAGTDAAGGADATWLALAAVAVLAGWAAATCSQCGSTSVRLPVGRVFAGQVAASFVGHVLPAGVGAAAVAARVLRRCGLSRSEVAAAIGLSTGASTSVHLIALVAVLAADPPSGHLSWTVLGVALAAISSAAVALWLARGYVARRAPRVAAGLAGVVAQARAVVSTPGRLALLSAGSVAQLALRVAILTAAVRSLGLSTPLLTVAVVYLGASAVSAAVPTPGGFGGLDVALLAAFASVGAPSRDAVAAIVLYRLVTVWLPIVPGAVTFLVLLRRKAI